MSNLQETNQEGLSETTAEKQPRGKPFKKGQSGNPAGRPEGTKNFDTLFAEAIKKIAKEKKINMKNPETEMVVKAVVEALKGNYSYFRDIMDRRYGRAKEYLDINATSKVEIQTIEENIKKLANEQDKGISQKPV